MISAVGTQCGLDSEQHHGCDEPSNHDYSLSIAMSRIGCMSVQAVARERAKSVRVGITPVARASPLGRTSVESLVNRPVGVHY